MESNFWQGFFKAIDCEYKNVKVFQGASGIKHNILCLGVDELKKRLIIVQDEQDARILAMVQADIQAKINGYNVLMVRPIPISLATAFATVGMLIGSNTFTANDIVKLNLKTNDSVELINDNKNKIEYIINSLNPQIEIIQKAKLNVVPIIKEVIQQLSHIKFITDIKTDEKVAFDFGQILTFNPVVHDNALGICPIPLYQFSTEDADCIIKSNDLNQNKSVLSNHGILEFFYPPIDSLALGFIDNNSFKTNSLTETLQKVPDNGHPFGSNELVEFKNVNNVIDALKEQGYVVEGELNLELNDKGTEKRMQVKFKPRESIFKRLANIFSIKVDFNLKDLIK